MDVLLIGSGGREHAIAWKLRQSPRLTDLHIAPGNAGTAELGNNIDVPVPKTTASQGDIDAYLEAAVARARALKVDLVFVAPDDPLSWGLVDAMNAAGIAAFGPSKAAARLEASKGWARDFMERHAIPLPAAATFDAAAEAAEYVRSIGKQVVVKADGLAVGKGAIVTSSTEEALTAIDELMTQRLLGDAGARVVIQERITAREVSGHAFSDGKTVVPMPLSCDHKTVFDGGQGPNTGGMGVYSPPWWADADFEASVRDEVLRPTVAAMASEGLPFQGILYPGIFATDDGPVVFEFNARFGDPEAQALLVRLESDLLDIVWCCVNGTLDSVDVRWSDDASVCVAVASQGYPGAYPTGLPITGIEDVDLDVRVFHAGTRRAGDGSVLTAGGRVLGVTATGATLADAREKAYRSVQRISFEGMHYRRDIGLRE